MSNEFDDFFADSPTFSPGESSDKQFLQPVIPSGTFHKSETSALKDDTFEWFVEDTGSYQEDSSVEGAPAEDDWFFSGSSSGYHGPGTRSVFDDIILSTRNGVARQIMTSLSQFTRTLARMGVSGPRHFKPINLDSRGRVIGVGSQFTVFVDGYGIKNLEVMKRVNKIFLDPEITAISGSDELRSHFRTLELEILSLCHPPLRDHRNIVDLIAWGYDYPTPDLATCLPVLFVEKAICSLSELLTKETMSIEGYLSWEVKHQLCLDIVEGLAILHSCGIVHGDVKPDNVLVFKQDNSNVPYLGKLSDFGVCISMEETHSLSFQSYRGTLGWIPPEVVEYQEHIHGEFEPELLLKCDCFSYGLVALSVLITGGRPPLDELEEAGEEEDKSPYEKAMDLIFSNVDETFPNSLQSKLMNLCAGLLKERPQERADMSHFLLADNSKGFNDWIFAKETAGKRAIVRVEGTGEMDTNKGPSYWNNLDFTVFEQLEQNFVDTDTGSLFPSETLFGMAVRHTVSRRPGFEKKILTYIGAAAKASYLPAQAIIGRLYKAHGHSLAAIANDGLAETWLSNAASTGSLIAAEDLAKLNPSLLQTARASFRKAGGYNKEGFNLTSIRDPLSNLDVDMARRLHGERGTTEFLVDLNGNRLLHIAAMFGKLDVIIYLVKENGAAINPRNDLGETPLYKACLAGHHSIVEALIALSADASITSKPYGLSPLHWLFNFEKQHISHISQLLVYKGGADVNTVTALERVGKVAKYIPFEHFPFHWPFGTPLHWAAFTRSVTAADALLDLGADINGVDSDHENEAQTALNMAAYRGDSEIMKYLLKKGADPRKTRGQGRTPFHMMTYNSSNRLFGFWKGFQSWVYNGSFETHLHEVRECVLATQKAGGDLDRRRDSINNTPLLDAANVEDCVVTLALLAAGANANLLDNYSQHSPLHKWASVDSSQLAYPAAFPIMFRQLLSRTKDINAKDKLLGETVLHLAVRTPGSNEDFEDRVRILVTQNPPANINATDNNGTTPLTLALSSRSPGEAEARSEILLRYKAHIDPKPGGNSRDFIFVICHNPILTDYQSLHLLKTLLNRFSEAEKRQMACSSRSKVYGLYVTALMVAVQNGQYGSAKYLLELGVDPNTIDEERLTVLDWALGTGEQVRRRFLSSVSVSFSPSERKQAIEKGSVFGILPSHEDTLFGDNTLTREKYFARPKIINHLISVGAKRARDLVKDAGTISYPAEWDEEFAQDSGGWYTVETQPYYEKWEVLYDLS